MFAPDSKLYPDYDQHLENSMIGESVEFFHHVLTHNLSIGDFLDSTWTMVNPRLALHYGMEPGEHDRFERVDVRFDDHRGGLLTHASVLSLTSDGTRHRPVHRGVWLSEVILGKTPPPPPANVDAIEPNPVDQPKATVRMKLSAHQSDPRCAACHRKIDPLGFAFDHYDAIGRWRTTEKVAKGKGADPPVDASGRLPDGRAFDDSQGLRTLLRGDMDRFHHALLSKLALYSLRRPTTLDDEPELNAIANASKSKNYRLSDLILELVTSDLFRQR